MGKRRIRAGLVAVAAGASFVLATAGGAGAANSEQVVFSIQPQFVGGTLNQPMGFWVWCEADSTNPYHGFCNGSMYFYEQGKNSEHVTGTISEPTEHIYKMTLTGANIACTLENQSSMSGPNNDITVSCTQPVSGTGTATNATVQVTGP
jgi:hypothetical protein